MGDRQPFIEFQSDHLLSKWGFDDGDLLVSLLKENGFPLIDSDDEFWDYFNRLVLCEVVEGFVCPQIENDIKPYRCLTSHNPMRVYEIEGKHVGNISKDEVKLEPEAIAVPYSKIIATAQCLYEQREQFKDSNGDWSYLIPSETVKQIRIQYGWE